MPLNPRLTDWNGRVVWLVGASTGIGRATAAALLARGAQVIVSARNIGALKTFDWPYLITNGGQGFFIPHLL